MLGRHQVPALNISFKTSSLRDEPYCRHSQMRKPVQRHQPAKHAVGLDIPFHLRAVSFLLQDHMARPVHPTSLVHQRKYVRLIVKMMAEMADGTVATLLVGFRSHLRYVSCDYMPRGRSHW